MKFDNGTNRCCGAVKSYYKSYTKSGIADNTDRNQSAR